MTEADFSGKKLGAAGAQILAAFMSTKLFEAKGSLSKLDLSGNNKYGFESPDFIRPIASALKTNTSITELSISGNNLNPEAASIFSDAIPDTGQLSKLTFGLRTPVTVEIGMTEADFSGASMGTGGAIILAVWLKHKVENMSRLMMITSD